MITRNHRQPRHLSTALPLVVFVVCATAFDAASAAENRKADVVSEILFRQKQKGDELNVYLRDATRIYVNGKQISLTTLATVVRKSRTNRAILSAEPVVTRHRVDEVKEVIRKGGLKDIKLTTPKQQAEQRQKEKPKQTKRAQSGLSQGVIQILARQEKKGDEIKVYLRDAKRIYVNGTQISLNTLATVVREMRPDGAIISAEPVVPRERVSEVKDVIGKSGVKKIKTTTPKQT